MNHLAIALVLILLTSGGFGSFVFLSTPRTQLIKIWCIFFLFVSLWALGLMLMLVLPSQSLALLSCRIANLAALFIPVLYLHFVFLLTEQYQKKKKILLGHYIFIFLYSLNAIIFPQFFIPEVLPKMSFHYYTTAGTTYYIFPFAFIWMVYYALKNLYQCYKHTNVIKKNQLKYVFIGTGIGFIGGFTTFPLVFNIPIYPWGTYLVPIYVLTVSYAILKHHLMDINIVIKKSLVYSILIAIVTGGYFIFVFLVERFFQGIVGYSSHWMSLTFIFLMVILCEPLRKKIQAFVDRKFFKATPFELAQENTLLRQEVADKEKFRAVATLASGMAHEIKNPLTAIKTFSEYLPLKMNDPEFLQKFSRIVGKEAERINDLVHQLLEFSRPSPPKLEDTSVQNLIDEVLDFLSSQLLNCHIKVERNYQLNGTLLKIDPNQFRQVFLNLFINAIEAMPKGGTLSITTCSDSSPVTRGTDDGPRVTVHGPRSTHVVITITDTGTGIPPDQLKNLFQPFHTTKVNGTGLGLSISKNIIENHGGTIQAENTVDKGTRFKIELPNC